MPPTYRQQLFVQWNALTQGNRSVSSYIQEWERFSVQCDVQESEEMRVGKFLAGLTEDLREKIELIPNLTVTLTCNHALTLEKYSKKKGS